MCYDKSYLTKKLEKYGKRYARTPKEEAFIIEQIEKLNVPATYYASGFSHPLAPVITDEHPDQIQAYSWGMIPSWSKDTMTAVKLSNQCLNARGETIFEKPAFRSSAKSKRCLIICIDGFFEHFHLDNHTYPHFIQMKNDEPMTFAGLWDRWENREEGVVRYTYTIVTTRANSLLTKLHNNPKREGGDSRMPVILPKELEYEWLKPINDKANKELIQSLIQPLPDELMEAWPVRQVKGKKGVGNSELAVQPFKYAELSDSID
jgi:putative SOS response-associated peptidase YedK